MDWKRIAAVAAVIVGVAGLVASTQLTGAHYGHDARLGGNDLSVFWSGAGRAYIPTAIFAWAYTAPWPWPLAFMLGMAGAVTSSILTFAGLAFTFYQRWNEDLLLSPDTFAASEWGTVKDAIAAGLVMGQGRAVKESRCIITLGRMGEHILTVTGDEHDELGGHIVGFGSSGSQKTRTVVIPTLLSWGSSTLTYTAGKLDVWKLTSGFREKFSDVRLIDLGDPNCSRFNPLAEVRLGTDHEIDDCRLIAAQFAPRADVAKDDPWWDKTGKKLLSACILHVLCTAHVKERNLTSVWELLHQSAEDIIEELSKSPRDYVCKIVQGTLVREEKSRDAIHETAQSYLDAWASPIVQRVTSESDFRLSDLLCNDRPMSLYLRLPSSMRDEWRPVLKVLISQVVRSMLHSETHMADGRAKKHKLAFVLDEFHSFGFPGWPEDLSEMRSYGGQAVMITQSEKTLEGIYGASQSISANCRVRLYLDAADPDTQQKVSRQIGTATEIRGSTSTSWQRGAWMASNQSKSEGEQTRALMDGGAARMLPRDQMLALITGCKPLKVSKLGDFDTREPFKSRLLPAAVATVERNAFPQKQKSDWRI